MAIFSIHFNEINLCAKFTKSELIKTFMDIKNIIGFLSELSLNNNKEWFHGNKQKYLKAKDEFEILVNLLLAEISTFDKKVSGVQAKDCIFRIYRDIRFSPDKTPYKTNFGAYMVRGGRKSGFAGYYFHIEPKNLFLAGGIYMPPPNVLKAIRDDIYNNIEEFKEIINQQKFREHFGAITGSKLTSAPKGFPKGFEDIDLLKFKDYNVVKELTTKDISNSDFIKTASEVFEAMVPLNKFLNHAVEDVL
jgi:uncharacterized protein (TIGR02453 family)